MGIWFICRMFGPLVGHLVSLDALVAWAPPDFDFHVGFLSTKGGDVPSGFNGILLPRPWIVGGHPAYGCLAICEDGYQAEGVVPGCRCLQGPREGRAFGVVRFLDPAYVGPVAFLGGAVLPYDGVSGCSIL